LNGLFVYPWPARYVSGYLESDPPPGQERLAAADASDAWFSVYVPQLGWVDFDPTNDQVPRDRHITTAHGCDYSDVTPLTGVLYSGGQPAHPGSRRGRGGAARPSAR